jgi:hypothetical protein
MEYFPVEDPIPVPAPIWLLKILHTATLSLHFLLLYFMIGGLIMMAWWGITGRLRGSAARINASGAIAQRVPVIIAFVINLGIPPLLFTQVLYGRALYTSSVLIGAYWIAVIGLIIAAYYLSYVAAHRAEAGGAFGWFGLASLGFVGCVAWIYVNNMTLMLRPEAWAAMYAERPGGGHLASGDPTMLPRWLFMMFTGLAIGGVMLMMLGRRGSVEAEARLFLRRRGALLLGGCALIHIGLGVHVLRSQPAAVQEALMSNAFYAPLAYAWLGTAALLALLGFAGAARAQGDRALIPVLALVVGFVDLMLVVLFRDGIRDVTLGLAGFDVWQRTIAPNWFVIVLFLVLFVAAVVAVAGMGLVQLRARGADETYA